MTALATLGLDERLTPEQLVTLMPLVRQAMRDKSYQKTPMGEEVARYLASKRKSLTKTSFRSYEGTLHKLVMDFPDCRLADFELPLGGERIEEWMDQRWGGLEPGTMNTCLAHVTDFFKWQVRHGRMHSNPCSVIDRARKRQIHRETFTESECAALLTAASRRDRIALRLLLHYGLRKGALQNCQIKHFDYARRWLTIFTKGEKVQTVPLVEAELWTDIEHYVLEAEAQPDHFLMHTWTRHIPRVGVRQVPEKAMGSTALHRWFKDRCTEAGVRALTIHTCRYTAGQRVLDRTGGDIKAAQELLGHVDIGTTAEHYVHYGVDRLRERMTVVLGS